MKKATFCFCFGVAALLALGVAARAEDGKGLPNPFYAMDTGTDSGHLSADEQAKLVKELGFAGIDIVYQNVEKVRAMAAACDRNGIRFFSIYTPIRIEKGQATDLGYVGQICEALKGRDAIIMLALNSKTYKPSSHEGNAQAVEVLRKVADTAQANGLRVAIYHHFSSWVERVDHAVALVKQADRKNLGVVFNLCHWLKTDGTQMEARIHEAMPYVFAVTICGADREGNKAPGWNRLIMTLDQGDFDVAQYLADFVRQGYTGPVGLQHYGIKGDARENLAKSMAAWKKIRVKAAALAAK